MNQNLIASNQPPFVGKHLLLYPYIDTPSILVAMFQAAYDKYSPRNREDTLVIIDQDLVRPKKVRGKRLLTIPARRIAEELGNVMVANTVMLGFLVAVTGIVSIEAISKSIIASVPKNTEELNLDALEQGYTYAQKLGLVQ